MTDLAEALKAGYGNYGTTTGGTAPLHAEREADRPTEMGGNYVDGTPVSEEEIRQRLQAKAMATAAASKDPLRVKVPMVEAVSTPVSGRYAGGHPGGHFYSAYGVKGMGDIGVSPSGRENIHRSLSVDANIAEAKAREVERKAVDESDMMRYAAKLRRTAGTVEANMMRESEMRRRQLDSMAKQMQKTMDRANRDFNTPDRLFDPRTGGAGGVLGILSSLLWSLTTPDYKRSAIDVANSIATQDYRNKMMRRQGAAQRAGMLNDALSYYERAYGRSVHAAEAYKAHLKNYMADQMESMAMQSSSEAIRQRAPIVAAEIRNQGFKSALDTLSKFYTPPRRGTYQPAIKLDEKGKPVGVQYTGPDGRMYMGQVYDADTIIQHPFGNKETGLKFGSAAEATKVRDALSSLAAIRSQIKQSHDLVVAGMSEPDSGKRQALFEKADTLSLSARGLFSKITSSGVLQKYELGDANDKMHANIENLHTITGRAKNAAKALGRQVFWDDLRTDEERTAHHLAAVDEMANHMTFSIVSNVPVAALKREHDSAGNVVSEAWVPSKSVITTQKSLSTDYPSQVVKPGKAGGGR